MPLQTVDVRGHQGMGTRTIALWDTGATLNLITPELASELRLRRKPVKLDVSGVGGITQEAGEACSLQMVDRKGRPWMLTAVVMRNISESVSGFPVKRAAKLFGRRPEDYEDIKGNAGLLIGCTMARHHPRVKEEREGVLYCENEFSNFPIVYGDKGDGGGLSILTASAQRRDARQTLPVSSRAGLPRSDPIMPLFTVNECCPMARWRMSFCSGELPTGSSRSSSQTVANRWSQTIPTFATSYSRRRDPSRGACS